MPLEISRSIKHVVQQQQFTINMKLKVTHNPGNKILKKADIEKEYQGSISLKIADKGFTVTDMLQEGEDFTDLSNRLTKLAILKLADNLFPSAHVNELKFKTIKEKKNET